MWGAAIRAAIGFAGLMLVSTLVKATAGPLCGRAVSQGLATSNVAVEGCTATIRYFPVLGLFGILAALIARGVVESSLPGQ